MTQGACAPAALAAGPRLAPLREEFPVVAVASAAAMLRLGVEVWNEAPLQAQPPAMVALVGAIFIAFGNAAWISVDRKHRGKPVDAWGFAALFAVFLLRRAWL